MKRLLGILLILIFAASAIPAFAGASAPRPILVTAYRQVGWGDAVQIGYVDEDGGVWYREGEDHDIRWPYGIEKQLDWLDSPKGFSLLTTLGREDLFILNSLVQCVEDQGTESTGAVNDAGTEISYAVRYAGDAAETVLLGESGDDRFENTDASAQALYLYLRSLFPAVTSYFGNPHMAPVGFQPVALTDFLGYGGVNLAGLTVERTDIECEASTEPVLLSDEEAAAVLDEILHARVTGKQSCIVTTGGSTVYAFLDGDKRVASFEFYRGLLVLQDGMYTVERKK